MEKAIVRNESREVYNCFVGLSEVNAEVDAVVFLADYNYRTIPFRGVNPFNYIIREKLLKLVANWLAQRKW